MSFTQYVVSDLQPIFGLQPRRLGSFSILSGSVSESVSYQIFSKMNMIAPMLDYGRHQSISTTILWIPIPIPTPTQKRTLLNQSGTVYQNHGVLMVSYLLDLLR